MFYSVLERSAADGLDSTCAMERSGAFQHGNEKLARCPVCAYPMVVPKDLKIFQCPSEECREESCLECGKPSHIPMTCEEANTELSQEKEMREKMEAEIEASAMEEEEIFGLGDAPSLEDTFACLRRAWEGE